MASGPTRDSLLPWEEEVRQELANENALNVTVREVVDPRHRTSSGSDEDPDVVFRIQPSRPTTNPLLTASPTLSDQNRT